MADDQGATGRIALAALLLSMGAKDEDVERLAWRLGSMNVSTTVGGVVRQVRNMLAEWEKNGRQ